MTGRVDVVGLGPGSAEWCTPAVRSVLAGATDWIGYGPYLAMAAAIVDPAGIAQHDTDNREEADRARHALTLAAGGARVAVVSSGDPGIFAMAAAVLEAADADPASSVEVVVHPGISAAQAAAARAGAPLGHDFCVISLSDNLKPWSVIEARLDAAAGADFVVALYNPRSAARPAQFGRAVEVLRAHRSDETPVVLGRDVGRPAESIRVVTLADLAGAAGETVDMRTVVIVGSSQTRVTVAGVLTPRSYPS